MREGNKLSAAAVRNAKEPGLYGDGRNLYLQVSEWGTKAWLFRYMIDGQARKMGLGALHTVGLAEARKRAAEARLRVLDGIDPIEDRKAARGRAKAEAAKVVTFKECAVAFIAANKSAWKSAKHAAQWPATLATYAYPVFGDLPVASVNVALVTKALEPIWQTKTETASRLRGRIETVLDWAKARGLRDGDNPARWRGHLDMLLPRPSKVARVEHLAAMSYRDVPAFMTELRQRNEIAARALEFCVLTAARSGEVIGAKWPEIGLAAKMWTVPGSRMKAGREHRVPLCNRAYDILVTLPHEGGLVFAGARKGKPLLGKSMLALLRDMRGTDGTVHGFRSSFRDWAAEQTSYPNELCEIALAHAVSDKVEAAYRRGDMMEKRRRLMADWADYCEGAPAVADNVTPIRGRAS